MTTTTDTSDVATTHAELNHARTEADAAERTAAGLEQFVLDGDTSVTVDGVERRWHVPVPRLRAQAAENRHARAVERERELDALADRVRTLTPSTTRSPRSASLVAQIHPRTRRVGPRNRAPRCVASGAS